MLWNENDDISAELERYYVEKMKVYRKEFMKSIERSVVVANFDLDQLGNSYGNLDFLFGNPSLRKEAFFKIYNKIVEYRDLARTELFHFKMLKEGAGNFPVCARKAYEICKKVFTEEINEETGFEMKVVYQAVFDDIDYALEEFRCKICRHINLIIPNESPFAEK